MAKLHYSHLKMFKKLNEGEPRRKLDFALASKHKLNYLQQNFLEEWLNNGHDQLEAYRKVENPKKLEGRAESTHRARAYQLMNSPRVQAYLEDFNMKIMFNQESNEPIITVKDVVTRLADIIRSEDSKHSDVIKASEVVLKHLNAFSDHNSSKSTKILTYINNQTTDDLINEINAIQNDLLIESPKSKINNNIKDFNADNQEVSDYIEIIE